MPTSNQNLVLLDTNILLRLASVNDPLKSVSAATLRALRLQGMTLCVCPQNMQEYRQVATRPEASNGYGWTSEAVAGDLSELEKEFTLIPETPAIYPEWRRITEVTKATGRANFDARLVATASVSNISAVLSFESAAFARYAACVPGLVIIDPTKASGL